MSSQNYAFLVEGRPRPKGRPRMSRKGHVYTPKETMEYQARIAEEYDGPMFEGPVLLRVIYTTENQAIEIEEMPHAKSKLRFDLDNALKATMDGLSGVAFPDDRQVFHVEATKL